MGTRARTVSNLLATGAGNVGAGGNLTISDILPLLTTANVVETANLYFTNLRVLSNLELASINIFSDVDTETYVANIGDYFVWNGNVWYPQTLSANAVLGDITTDDIPEGNVNLYFSGKNTDDLPESPNSYGNLYFTNARARFAISAANPTIIYDPFTGGISANLQAVAASANTTDTLPEGFVNRYYTNARVFANLQTLSVNIFSDVFVENATNGKVLVYNANRGWWEPGDTVYSAIVAQEANIVLTLDNFTTSNLVEGVNLYYSNDRVQTYLTNALANLSINDLGDVDTTVGKVYGTVLTWNGTAWVPNAVGEVSLSTFAEFAEYSNIANIALRAIVADQATNASFANLAANAYFADFSNTSFRSFYAEVANTVLTAATVDNLNNFTTDDLREGANNLYYTDARVYANLEQTSINVHSDVDAGNANPGQVLTWNGSFWQASNTISQAEASGFAERANVANLVLSLENLNTDNLQEGSNNLYYSNLLVENDIEDILRGKYIDIQELNVQGNITVNGDSVNLNVDDLNTQSKTLILNKGGTYSGTDGSGLYIEGANAEITFNELTNSLTVNKDVIFAGNLLPSVSGTYNLGNQSKFWRSIYIGGQTLFLGNLKLSQGPTGLEVVDTETGEFAEVGLSNVSSIEFVTVDRIRGNTTPEVELRSYIGGNTEQFLSGQTANIYFGIMTEGNVEQFAGMRVVESNTRTYVNSYPVLSINIIEAGNGYIDGNVELQIFGGAGRGARANVELGANGEIIVVNMLSYGEYYEYPPEVVVYRNDVANVGVKLDANLQAVLSTVIQDKYRTETDIIFYNDKEGTNTSTERLALRGRGNVDINSANVNISVQANSNVTINNDPVVTYNPLGQSLGLLRAAIEAPTGNVLYVSIDGDDNNTGTALSNSLANLHTALARANAWTTIFLKAGDHVLYEQPVTIKARVGIVGDNLRTTTVRPSKANVDMFYVENASYCTGITFRGHTAPAAVFSYNPDGSAGIITTSPYIQNCSSITGTGTGMRVDGAYVQGLRSMVCDSYTQTNSGGIGIHMLNRGYTQLVSVFTITCNIAILAERGGFCSITNSNSSFGTYGLVARGVSDPLYYGKFDSVIETDEGQQLIVKNLSQKPNYGDVLIIASYNQAKCSRDTGLIVDSLAIDIGHDSNTQSNFAGLQYWAQSETAIPNQSEETLAAFAYAKDLATNVIQSINISPDRQSNVAQIFGIPGTKVAEINAGFELIANIIESGTVGVSDRIIPNSFPPVSDADTTFSASLLERNKEYIAAETVAYVRQTFPGFFDDPDNFVVYTTAANAEAKCSRDVGYIIDCVYFDLLHGGNRQAIQAGVYYYNFNANVTQIENQIQATSEAYDFIGSIIGDIIHANTIASTYQTEVTQNTTAAPAALDFEVSNITSRIDLITNIIENGPSVAEVKQPIEYNLHLSNAINASKLILANRDFIVAEVTAYVNANWANITNNGEQQFYTVSNSTPLVGNTCNVTLLELIEDPSIIFANSTISFHQPSYISASGHTFEYVGSGDELATALPYNGGMPIQENEVIESLGGRVYFTSTDQQGDFRIGTELTINRVDGTITGRTFNKSLFSVMTPYILAIEG